MASAGVLTVYLQVQQTWDLTDLVETSLDARMAGVYTALPGVVTAYDSSIQAADVQPGVWGSYEDEAGNRVPERLPIVQKVPVVFPGAGGFRVTFPVQVGDTCLLVFSSRSLDRWLSQGGDQDPGDDRQHTISDAICIPGLRDFGHALANAPTTTMSLGHDAGPTIEIDDTHISIGTGLTTDTTFLSAKFLTAFSTLVGSIGTAVGGIPGGGAAGTAIGTALTLFLSPVVKATYVTQIAKVT